MKEQGSSVVVTLVAVAVSFTACNRVLGMKSAQAVTGVATQPAPQKAQPSAAAQTAPAIPSSPLALSASPSLPVVVPKSDAPPPRVVVSDRSQSLIVARHTFHLLTHVQSIEGITDETVEWWELRDAKEHVVYRESYPVAFENGMFASSVGISANSFTTKQGSGMLVHGMERPTAPDGGGWRQGVG